MIRNLSLLLLVLVRIPLYGQELSANIKVANNVAPGKDLVVELTVTKPGVTGFVKYFQEIPAGYSAADIDSKGGSFTFADNGAKIIWITPPSDDQYVMTYKIGIPASATGTLNVGGKFAYVVGNERKTFEIPLQTVTIGGSSISAVKETAAPEKKPGNEQKPRTEEIPVSSENKTPPVAEKNKPAEIKTQAPETKTKPTETKKEPVVTVPAGKVPVTAAATSTPGKTYKVQIGAFSQKPKLDGIPELSSVLLDNGVTKYFSGNFSSYEDAKKRREQMVANGFQGAFIVSFENGKIVK
jgi:hypothetical protein